MAVTVDKEAKEAMERGDLAQKPGFCDTYVERIPEFSTNGGVSAKLVSRYCLTDFFCSKTSGAKERLFHNLDVRRALLHYLVVTRDFRSSNSLLVCSFSGNKMGRQASKGSIARWLRSAIVEAYFQMKLPLRGLELTLLELLPLHGQKKLVPL